MYKLPIDPIDRLADVPSEDYTDALSILFVCYARFPRMNVQFGRHPRHQDALFDYAHSNI